MTRPGPTGPATRPPRRPAAADVWLTTGYERDTADIAVHQFHRMDGTRYFAAFEQIVREHAGRPHWGKLVLGR